MKAADVESLLPRRREDPRVGEHEVDPPEFGDAVGHDVLEPLEVPDVALLGDDAAAGLLDEVDRLVEILRGRHRVGDAVDLIAQVERDDVGAFLGEPDRVRAALTPRRAGDEGDLAVELSRHDALRHLAGAWYAVETLVRMSAERSPTVRSSRGQHRGGTDTPASTSKTCRPRSGAGPRRTTRLIHIGGLLAAGSCWP